jgi:hypothetical protein
MQKPVFTAQDLAQFETEERWSDKQIKVLCIGSCPLNNTDVRSPFLSWDRKGLGNFYRDVLDDNDLGLGNVLHVSYCEETGGVYGDPVQLHRAKAAHPDCLCAALDLTNDKHNALLPDDLELMITDGSTSKFFPISILCVEGSPNYKAAAKAALCIDPSHIDGENRWMNMLIPPRSLLEKLGVEGRLVFTDCEFIKWSNIDEEFTLDDGKRFSAKQFRSPGEFLESRFCSPLAKNLFMLSHVFDYGKDKKESSALGFNGHSRYVSVTEKSCCMSGAAESFGINYRERDAAVRNMSKQPNRGVLVFSRLPGPEPVVSPDSE